MSEIIYYALRLLVRIVLDVYFSRIEIEGEEEVPEGPIVLASTHPNAFIDVALVVTRLKRRVRFVAKASLFKHPLGGWFLRTVGAVPVERRMERGGESLEPEAQARNAQALNACEEAVAEGGAVLIFPEGTSEAVPKLLPLKTGVARIALGADARRGRHDVSIVPVAVRYDNQTDFRSHARIRFLPAIPVSTFQEMEKQGRGNAVHALTAAVRDALEPSVVHVEDETLAPLVAEIDALYGRELAATQSVAFRLASAPAIARAVNAFARTSPERIARVREQIARYRAALEAAGLEDLAIRPGPRDTTPGNTVALVAGAPLALWGMLHHLVPYQATRYVTRTLVQDLTMISTIKLVAGTLIYLAWYTLETVVVLQLLGLWPALAWLLSLPLAGIVALETREALRARAGRRRRRQLRSGKSPEVLRELDRLRQQVVLELDRARAEFLLAQAEPAAEGLS